MNETTTPPPASPSHVGLLGGPRLATALRQLGYRVAGGTGSLAVDCEAVDQSDEFTPVLAAGRAEGKHGVRRDSTLARRSATMGKIVLLAAEPDARIPQGAVRLEAGATVADVLKAAGVSVNPDAETLMIGDDGDLADPTASSPVSSTASSAASSAQSPPGPAPAIEAAAYTQPPWKGAPAETWQAPPAAIAAPASVPNAMANGHAGAHSAQHPAGPSGPPAPNQPPPAQQPAPTRQGPEVAHEPPPPASPPPPPASAQPPQPVSVHRAPAPRGQGNQPGPNPPPNTPPNRPGPGQPKPGDVWQLPDGRTAQMAPDGAVFVLNAACTGWDPLTPPPAPQPPPKSALPALPATPPAPQGQPQPPAPPQPAVQPAVNPDQAFTSEAQSWERMHDQPGAVVAVMSPKGGVGKSSTSLQLAQRAAKAGLRVVYVDLNRGQGGGRILLRQTSRTDIPTIYDFAVAQQPDPMRAVIMPARLNEGRSRQFDKIEFAAVFAPPENLPERSLFKVDAAIYRMVIEYARDVADLVVVDTQTLEQADASGLIDNVVQPGLRGLGWWGLFLAPAENIEGAQLLDRRLNRLARSGVGAARLMYAVTQYRDALAERLPVFANGFRRYAWSVGEIYDDPEVRAGLSESRFGETRPTVVAALDSVLLRVTGNPAFDVAHAPPGKGGGGLGLGRLFGGKKKAKTS